MRLYTKILGLLILVCLLFPLNSQALTDPAQYTPPVNSEGLYPTPDDPNFPEPGHFMRETLGFTVDEVNDTVKYFRSDEFMNSMRDLRRQLQQILDQNTNTANQQQYFPDVYQKAQTFVSTHRSRLEEKLEYNLTKPWLNDDICVDIDHTCSATGDQTDNKIKSDIQAFFDAQMIQFEKYALQIQQSQDVKTLKTVVDSIQAYTDNQILRDQAKSIGARVLSQRILAFSKFIQDLVLYMDCIAPRLGQAGFDISYYQAYMQSMASRFKTGWYQTTEIRDPKRPWETFNFVLFDEARSSRVYTSHGAKWEYWTAHNILKSPTCKGNTKCKEDTTMHMRAAKYNLQDMFHVFYGFYDRIQKQIESGKQVSGQVLSQCKMPSSVAAPQGGGLFGQPKGTGTPGFTYSPTGTRPTSPWVYPTSAQPPVSGGGYAAPTSNFGRIGPTATIALPSGYVLPTRRLTR